MDEDCKSPIKIPMIEDVLSVLDNHVHENQRLSLSIEAKVLKLTQNRSDTVCCESGDSKEDTPQGLIGQLESKITGLSSTNEKLAKINDYLYELLGE